MKIVRIGEPKILQSNPLSKHNYFAWPTVARLKNGKIALASSGFRLQHICPFGKAVLSFSEDEGQTYTAPAPIIDTVLDDRDAGLCPFGASGLILTSFNNDVAFQRKSGQGGEYRDRYLDMVSEEEQNAVLGSTFRVSFDNGVTFGPLYRSPITSPHGPLEMPDGTIVYVGRTFSRTQVDCISAYTLDPHTGAMDYLGSVENVEDEDGKLLSCEPHAIVLPDGSILCHIRLQRSRPGMNYDTFATYQSVSRDGGRTWTVPVCISGRVGGAPAHLLRHSSGLLISVAARRNDPCGIVVFFSKDNGETWSESQFLYEDSVSRDLGYPATVELKDGSLQTVFYAHPKKGDPAVILGQIWKMEE